MKNFQIWPFRKNGCLTEGKGLKEERGEIRNAHDHSYSMRESKIQIARRARGDCQSRADSLSIALSILYVVGAVVWTLLIIAAGVGACGDTEHSRAAAL
jgi:hypothetical protein